MSRMYVEVRHGLMAGGWCFPSIEKSEVAGKHRQRILSDGEMHRPFVPLD